MVIMFEPCGRNVHLLTHLVLVIELLELRVWTYDYQTGYKVNTGMCRSRYCPGTREYQGCKSSLIVSRFPGRFEQAVQRNTDWLRRSLIGRATDNSLVVCINKRTYSQYEA